MKSNSSRAERQGRTIVNFNDNGSDEADGSWAVSMPLSLFLSIAVANNGRPNDDRRWRECRHRQTIITLPVHSTTAPERT